MNFLLNISTHGSDLKLIGEDWSTPRHFMNQESFDGFELYPVSGYDNSLIPVGLIKGIHLRFFIIIDPIWNGNQQRLMEIFGNEETIEHFYGGRDRSAIIDTYRQQMDLAEQLGCEYVVFHPTHCELEYVWDWKFPWSWESTVDLSADIINEVVKDTQFKGQILFENLWWPGNFRLDQPEEIDRLLSRVNYANSGIVFDTGHLINKNQTIKTEPEAIEYLTDSMRKLGSLTSTIKAVHLTRSLSAEYVLASRKIANPFAGCETFWDRLTVAREHVERIDTHDAFEDPGIARLFDWIDPDNVVFEFSFTDLPEWQSKVSAQKKALGKVFTASA